MTITLHPGDIVDDFYGSHVPAASLAAQHVRASAGYLKNIDRSYNATLFLAGVGFVPIFEAGELSAMQGGAALGAVHGAIAVRQAQAAGIPTWCPTGIIFTHDTGGYNANVPLYFKAAYDVVRAAGYLFSGYLAKDPANACMAAGVTFTIIWAPAATSWGGGRHPDAHVWQRPSSMFPGTNLSVDMGIVRRQFDVWDGRTPAPTTTPATGAATATQPQNAPTQPTAPQPAATGHTAPNPINVALEGDMKNAIFTVANEPAVFTGIVNDQGAALDVEWSGPGTPECLARLAAHRAAGAVDLTIVRDNLKNCVLHGPIPDGWTAADFYRAQ